MGRQVTGRRNTEWGVSAEEAAVRHYRARGALVRGRRVRTEAGEIDLILEEPNGTLVFVEVKARRRLDDARHALSARQASRIADAAALWCATRGLPHDTELRVDVVVQDKWGGFDVIENALAGLL
ncbi:MAG: YraN family protein [Pseudomonadota bacterium]